MKQRALNDVRKTQISPKVANTPDSLMVQTLELEEGSFEKVRFNLPDEQGQSIRQLISSRVIQRVGWLVCVAFRRCTAKSSIWSSVTKRPTFLFKQVDAHRNVN